MEKKTYRGVSRNRRLTKSEADKYDQVREQVRDEIPPGNAAPLKVAIAKLRAMRQAKGVSVSELSARTGIARGQLTRLEMHKNATLPTLQRYAAGLDCQLVVNIVSVEVVKEKRKRAAAV